MDLILVLYLFITIVNLIDDTSLIVFFPCMTTDKRMLISHNNVRKLVTTTKANDSKGVSYSQSEKQCV